MQETSGKEGFRESFDIVSSRAVASLSLLLEFTIPFLKVNGLFLAMKGPSYLEEVEDSKNAFKKLNCKLEKVVNFKIEQNGEISERNKCVIVVTHSKEVASAADTRLELNNKRLKEVTKNK